MNTHELNTLLFGRVPTYLGAFPCDQLPVAVPNKAFLIVNTDPSQGVGRHWQTIAVCRRTAYFFDSFGRRPYGRQLLAWLRRRFHRVVWSEARSQRATEETCGPYCVYVIMRMHRGASFRQLVRQFRTMRNDDAFVRRYMWRTFGYAMRRQSGA